MSKIIDLVLGLIAYVCVATVITAALAFAYFWHTDELNSDKMFRIVALLQDVDLEKINAAQQKKTTYQVPPEEPSLKEVTYQRQVQDRNFEVKLLALKSGKQEYDESLRKLNETIDRYDRLVQDVQSRLKQQQELTTQQNVAKVVSQLEEVSAEVGKESLMKWIDEGRMDDAILLMSRMSENKLAKILKTFQTEQELTKLHEIHLRIMSGGPESERIKNALGELSAPDDQK